MLISEVANLRCRRLHLLMIPRSTARLVRQRRPLMSTIRPRLTATHRPWLPPLFTAGRPSLPPPASTRGTPTTNSSSSSSSNTSPKRTSISPASSNCVHIPCYAPQHTHQHTTQPATNIYNPPTYAPPRTPNQLLANPSIRSSSLSCVRAFVGSP
ncbi:hypothetical protein BCR43DRAFT_335208 [Syncephalastrum racemosum]|uniref:Uncharacterized protein n=1 Tax=Syncephalastrum racemosum TaxID=13706 RepID=A0A1X2H8J7_SYNRA|nr:hypothetical protein BCR43DRAFT_335208 [Syncephalastrum racemosum]